MANEEVDLSIVDYTLTLDQAVKALDIPYNPELPLEDQMPDIIFKINKAFELIVVTLRTLHP